MPAFALFALMILWSTACRLPHASDPRLASSLAPSPVTEFVVKEARLANGAMQVHLDIPRDPGGPKPTVIALLGDSHELMAAGFVAVTYRIDWALLKGPSPPPAPTEQTVGKWVLTSPSAATLGQTYLQQIAATATEYIPQLLDWLETIPDVDARRIGMVGGSTNGFVTLEATAGDGRITTAVTVGTCGDYLDFLRHSSMGLEGQPLRLDPGYERWIHSREVVSHPQQLLHAAVLMMNRADDQLIPVSCADTTAGALQRTYARAGKQTRFRYVRLPEGGHGFGPAENTEAIAWLRDRLQPR